jgi:hypothetical protein
MMRFPTQKVLSFLKMGALTRSGIAAQFVVAYYSAFVYNPETITHFYSASANVFRRERNRVAGVPIRDLPPRTLAISLQERAKLNVAGYSVLELDNEQITISVDGILEQSPTRRFSFAQNFVLEEREERMFVIRDSLLQCDDQTDFNAVNFVVGKGDESGGDDGRLRKKVRTGRSPG